MTALENVSNLRPKHGGWQPINLANDPDTLPDPPDLGGFGIAYRGKRHVFSGPQESAKTIAAYAIGLETLRTIPNRYIAIIDYEMGRRTAKIRLRELGATDEELARILYIEPETPATKEIIEGLITYMPQLIIIDAAAGAYSMQGLNDNDRGDVERFTQLYVDAFHRAGIATIILDHVVKNSETRGKYAIGSERKTGGVDVHLGFDTILPIKRGSTGLYKVTTHKDRDGWHQRGQLAELHLTSCPETHSITWEWRKAEHTEPGQEWLPTKLMQKISGILEQKTEPVSRKSTIEEVGGRPEYARKAIDALIRLDRITQTDGSHGAKLLTHKRAFTVLDWEKEQDSHNVVPPSPNVVPDQVTNVVRPSPPPTGGTGLRNGPPDHPPSPDEQTAWSWLDDLEPPDTTIPY